jgi:hypothetical protein
MADALKAFTNAASTAVSKVATALTPNKNAKNAAAAPMKPAVNQKAANQKKNNNMKKLQAQIKLAELERKPTEETEVAEAAEEEPNTTGDTEAQGLPLTSSEGVTQSLFESSSKEGGGRRKRRHTRKQKRRGRKSRRYRKH